MGKGRVLAFRKCGCSFTLFSGNYCFCAVQQVNFRVRFWLYWVNANIAGKIWDERWASPELCLNTGFVTLLSFITLPTAFLSTRFAAGGHFHKLNYFWLMCVKRRGKLLSAFGILQYIWKLILAPLVLSCWDKLSSLPFSWKFCFLDFDLLLLLRSKLPVSFWKYGSLEGFRPQLRFKWDGEKTILNTVFLFVLSMLLTCTRFVIHYILRTLPTVPQSEGSCSHSLFA